MKLGFNATILYHNHIFCKIVTNINLIVIFFSFLRGEMSTFDLSRRSAFWGLLLLTNARLSRPIRITGFTAKNRKLILMNLLQIYSDEEFIEHML